MTTMAETHNRLAGKFLKSIVRETLDAGCSTGEIYVVLESVVAGVLMACGEIEGLDARGRDSMLMALETGVRNRLVEMEIKRGMTR